MKLSYMEALILAREALERSPGSDAAMAEGAIATLQETGIFLQETAQLYMDGEVGQDGEPLDLANDDAVDSLHSTIREARRLSGMEYLDDERS